MTFTSNLRPPHPQRPHRPQTQNRPPLLRSAEGKKALSARPNERMRVDVNLVLVPVAVTDPLNRLVTGLERQDFFVYENNALQKLKSFSAEDAPVSIGIIFDLSGSMTDKINRARNSILEFLRTANPQDEFFVIGFNDRPELIADFTNNVDNIETRLLTVKPGHRTALLDAIYFGLNKMKQAKNSAKRFLVVSDGGDNRSRYTESRSPLGGARVRCADLFHRHLRPVRAYARRATGADSFARRE